MMSVSPELKQLLERLRECEGRDLEGSRTYRVHISSAEQLIKDAYSLGCRHGSSEGDGRW
jgi:hypothetical protein